MLNPKEKIDLGKINPEHRQKLLKGETFKFSEEEKIEKMKKGMSGKDIEEKEGEIIKKQKLARQETTTDEKTEPGTESEKKGKKISFEEYKARQETDFQEKADEARKDLEAAYGQEDSGEEKKEAVL